MRIQPLRIAIVLFALGVAQPVMAQSFNHIKLSSDKVENSAKFKSGNDYQKDVLLFVDMLSTTHPAFGRGFKAPLKIDSLQNAAYRWAKNCTSIDEFRAYIQSIASVLGDGHTAVVPNLTNFEIYPFMFAKVGDVYCLITTAKEFETSLTKQIAMINHAPIEDVLGSFRSSFSCDNDVDFINRLSKQVSMSTLWKNCAFRSADQMG